MLLTQTKQKQMKSKPIQGTLNIWLFYDKTLSNALYLPKCPLVWGN